MNLLYSGKRKAVAVGELLSSVVNVLFSKQKTDKPGTLGHNTVHDQILAHNTVRHFAQHLCY